MRVQTITVLSAALGLAAAQPAHRHHAAHQHLHDERDAVPDVATTYVAGPTVVAYSLNGKTISEADVMEGIKNGTLIWANGAPELNPSSSSAASSTSASSYVASTSSAVVSKSSAPATSSASSASAYSSSSAASSASSSAASSTSSSSSGWSNTGSGMETTFPDGKVKCTEFPSDYGAISVDWLNLDGWTGVQQAGSGSTLEALANIVTVIAGECDSAGCCSEGSYCSYACPAGYQKAQWPSSQGSTGQSVGGLECKSDGYLYKTNSDYDTLCIKGTDAVTVQVKNTLSQGVAVCRTDYPGTESETIPVWVAAGETVEIACPDESTYYEWEGALTSAQYYINPAGIDVDTACTWGSEGDDYGNYAPLNLGVGYSSSMAWLSIQQNYPTTTTAMNYSVKLEGGEGGSGECSYDGSSHEFCDGEGDCAGTDANNGCTVSAASGTVTFVISS